MHDGESYLQTIKSIILEERMKYPVCDYLFENSNIHCASLMITENIQTIFQGEEPISTFYLRNGTITFVEYNKKVYGITAEHVIKIYRDLVDKTGNKDSHSMWVMVNGFNTILDRFITPQPQFGQQDIDIAIREINPKLLEKIGKIPFNLNLSIKPPSEIKHGFAVGFPEVLKKKIDDINTGTHKISMPHANITAEINTMPNSRFSLNSELPVAPKENDFSGMSGGPIFWSTEDNYGIFGIIYEGSTGNELSKGKSVHVFGELATKEVIIDWISQYESSKLLK